MTKKLLIFLLTIMVAGLLFFVILRNSHPVFYWGHHFSFENELSISIDSLDIDVGGIVTTIHAGTDSLKSLEGNIDVPEKGYPHIVTFRIYSGQEILTLEADSFDCYNCDGDHQYILKNSGAEYIFRN